MKIVADENIPLLDHFFGAVGTIERLPGRAIVRKHVLDADILLVRSVTKVNAELLKNTSVKFVGSATSGADHLDIDWLESENIKWSTAKGCNRQAVTEYVVCVLAALLKMRILNEGNIRAAVIGVGEIGQEVVNVLKYFNVNVIQCDPLRAKSENTFLHVPFDEIQDVDLITLHVPLIKTGEHPTFHFIEKNFLKRQKKNSVLINTSRGEVINSHDLKLHGKHLHWCLDVFENEPNIDVDILENAIIATPHIAGYSIQAKYRGTEMLYHAAVDHHIISPQKLQEFQYPCEKLSFANKKVTWRDVVLRIFNLPDITQHMKKTFIANPNAFDELRKHFVSRYEFGFVELMDLELEAYSKKILELFR